MSLAKLGIKDEAIRLFTVRELIEKDWLHKPLDGNHGEIHPKSEDFVASGIPFVMASDIVNGRVDYTQCNHITRKQADSLRKGFAHNGDVLLTHKATIGRTAIVGYAEQPYIMLTPQVTYYRVKNSREISNKYLRYFFDLQFFQDTIKLWAGAGSTRAYLGITEQQRLPVLLPDIERQEKIASILSAYDDLIENNRRRIELLEKIAEELYREWFVRFRFPGYQQAAFNKGIPVGWKIGKLSDLVRINPPEKIDKSETKPFVAMDDLSTGSMLFSFKEMRAGSAGSKFRNRDVLLPRITPSLENGKRGFVMVLDDNQVGIGSTEFIVLREQVLTAEYIYFLSISRSLREHAELSMTGASGRQRVQENCLDFFLVPEPPPSIMAKFSEIVAPHFKELHLLAQKERSLAATRDALLARLISGKLPIDQLDIQFPPSMREADAARQEVAHA